MTSRHAELPKRLALTDLLRGGSPFEQLERLDPTDALILRHYELPTRERAELAKALRQGSGARGVRLLIAGSQRLALHVKADGLHLPRWLLTRGCDWRRGMKPAFMITAATHNEAELLAAVRAGVDAALLSPVFPTGSHPGAKTLGPVKFAALAGRANVPVYALGGATAASMQRLAHVENLAGWAAVSRV
jgi:thiamine-phosphate pyrophosphorylase